MIHPWLGQNWPEIKKEIDNSGKPYVFQITRPHGKMESWGDCRVVRVREFDGRLDIVLAHEKFSPRQN